MIGGIVLLTPGLLTDLMGFALMVPGIRRYVRDHLKERLAAKASAHFRAHGQGRTRTKDDDDVIEI